MAQKALSGFAAVALALALTGSAKATVVFSDFGPGGTFAGTGRIVSSGLDPDFSYRNSPGYSFVAGAAARVSQIDIGFNSIAGSVNVGLFAAVPYTGPGHGLPGFGTTEPGAELGSWTVTDTGYQVVESIAGITGITLAAGTDYFLGLSLDPTATKNAIWGDDSVGLTGDLWQCADSDPVCAPGNISLADATTGAFDVLANPVSEPEPGSLWLLGAACGGLGFGGLLGLRRDKRRLRAA